MLGTEALAGAQIGADLANERGGVLGQTIVLDTADATSPAIATNEARRLINRSGLKLLVGAYGSSISLAIAAAANQLKVPYFEGAAVADDLTQRGYRYVFRLNDNANAMAAAQVQGGRGDVRPQNRQAAWPAQDRGHSRGWCVRYQHRP
ncbi:MAG: ABC transporter substrate-binding protein [Acetobacteraceae bacterium]